MGKNWWTKSVAPPEVDWLWSEEEQVMIRPRTRDDIIKEIKKHNSYRWWRLNHDYKWLKKRMKKMGLSPDDARELLR